jgi:hypothetical protein
MVQVREGVLTFTLFVNILEVDTLIYIGHILAKWLVEMSFPI